MPNPKVPMTNHHHKQSKTPGEYFDVPQNRDY